MHSSYYVGTLIADNKNKAQELRERYCSDRLYPPLHKQPYYYDIEFAVMSRTEEMYELLVNLPLYDKLS